MISSTIKILPKRWQAVPAQAFDLLYPPVCLVCSEAIHRPGDSILLCMHCRPGPQHRIEVSGFCRECGSIDEALDGSKRCLSCRLLPIGALSTSSMWWYSGAVEQLLKRYKYTWQPLLGDYLASELAAFVIARQPERPWNLVAAVPSSPQALRKRGFHHLGLVARKTAKLLGVPSDILAIRATHKERNQARLSPRDRSLNAQGAFNGDPPRVRGKRVLLLDDVITSGETIRSAAGLLRANGAVDVTVVTIARSVNFPVLRRAAALGTTLLISLAVLCGCDQNNSEELKRQVSELRAEVQDLQNLRKEVDYLRGSLSRREPPQEGPAGQSPSANPAAPDPAGSNTAGSAGQQPANNSSLPPAKINEAPITPAEFSQSGSLAQSLSEDPFLGPPLPEHLVMAFIDYQCGPCREFYRESFQPLKEEFVDSGKVSLYLRDFPLEANQNSKNAAALAHCAGEQGAYWPMFQLLFENTAAVDEGSFEMLAGKLGSIDQDKLKQCFASGRYGKELEGDVADGIRLGARGAPGFFIGRKQPGGAYRGVFVRGAQPLRVLRSEIKKMLSSTQKGTV